MHIKAISVLPPSMPTLNVSSKTVPDLRGELMSISAITMTYPNLAKDLNYHKKENTPPKTNDFVDEHESYFQLSHPFHAYIKKSPKSFCNIVIPCKIYNPILLFVIKNFKRVVVDTFIYHKFCKFRGVLAWVL